MSTVIRIGIGNLGRVCAGAGRRWATVGVLALALVVFPLAEQVGATPYAGVDTWYAYGLTIDEQTVIDLANAVVRRGLKAAGYEYVWIDAGWWRPTAGPGTPGARDAAGDIELDPAQWPHGLRWLTDYVHSLGLRAGIYTDAGPVGCGNGGSWGHYQQDADQFATWGFDAVKVDYCSGGRTGNTPRQNYTAFRAAVDATGRPMLLDITNVQSDNGVGYWLWAWRFGPLVATAWRTGPDIGWPGHVTWSDVLRNLDDDALHPSAQSRGHYNDPDYLVPGPPKTQSESAAQVSMWAILAAPFMTSVDLSHTPRPLLSLVTNREVIAIDQDPRDVQGRELGTAGVWIKPMTAGVAVAFLNRSNRSRAMTASDASIGLGRSLTVRNVWKHASRPVTGNVSEIVAPRSATLITVHARRTQTPRRMNSPAPARTSGAADSNYWPSDHQPSSSSGIGSSSSLLASCRCIPGQSVFARRMKSRGSFRRRFELLATRAMWAFSRLRSAPSDRLYQLTQAVCGVILKQVGPIGEGPIWSVSAGDASGMLSMTRTAH